MASGAVPVAEALRSGHETVTRRPFSPSRRFEDTGHSKSARDMLKKYFIGAVPEAEERTIGSKSESGGGAADGSSSSLTWVAYAIPAIIVLLAVLYQYGLIGGGPARK